MLDPLASYRSEIFQSYIIINPNKYSVHIIYFKIVYYIVDNHVDQDQLAPAKAS